LAAGAAAVDTAEVSMTVELPVVGPVVVVV